MPPRPASAGGTDRSTPAPDRASDELVVRSSFVSAGARLSDTYSTVGTPMRGVHERHRVVTSPDGLETTRSFRHTVALPGSYFAPIPPSGWTTSPRRTGRVSSRDLGGMAPGSAAPQ